MVDGLENAPQAFIGLLEGKNFGKLVIRIAQDWTCNNSSSDTREQSGSKCSDARLATDGPPSEPR
jgi:hypothetical protein